MADLIICVQRKDFPAEIPHPFFLPESSPAVLCGPTEYLKRQRVAVLNSRQSPRFVRRSAWVEKTLEALRSYDPKDTILITSLGTTPWDFLSWAGSKMSFPLILVFPAGSAHNFNVSRTRAIMELGLDKRKTLAVRPLGIKMGHKRAASSALRDIWIMALSHRFAPVSIRPKGNLAGYLAHPQLESGTISRRFEIPYEAPRSIKRPAIPREIILPDWYRPEDYLIHWTRSCVGPWPDESRAEFFSRLMEGEDVNTDGLTTLRRILRKGVVRASGRLIRGGYQVVPFTERPPENLPQLIRYRASLRRWTFEPYGVALKKSRLLEMGTRPVIYGEISDFESMSEDDRPFFQMTGSGKRDWRGEKEWRIRGDVKLNTFSENEVVIIVLSLHEALQLKRSSLYRIISLSHK